MMFLITTNLAKFDLKPETESMWNEHRPTSKRRRSWSVYGDFEGDTSEHQRSVSQVRVRIAKLLKSKIMHLNDERYMIEVKLVHIRKLVNNWEPTNNWPDIARNEN